MQDAYQDDLFNDENPNYKNCSAFPTIKPLNPSDLFDEGQP